MAIIKFMPAPTFNRIKTIFHERRTEYNKFTGIHNVLKVNKLVFNKNQVSKGRNQAVHEASKNWKIFSEILLIKYWIYWHFLVHNLKSLYDIHSFTILFKNRIITSKTLKYFAYLVYIQIWFTAGIKSP